MQTVSQLCLICVFAKNSAQVEIISKPKIYNPLVF